MDNVINKVIKINRKEENQTKAGNNTIIRLLDQDGVKYVFFKKSGAGTAKEAFSSQAEQFKNMGLDKGSTVRIGYVVEEYVDSKGFTRSSNKIINFMETQETPSESPQTAAQPAAASSSSLRPIDVSIVRQVAFKGAIELAREGIITPDLIAKETDDFERILRRAAFPNPIKPVTEELPTIQVGEDEGSGTPFDDIAKDIPY